MTQLAKTGGAYCRFRMHDAAVDVPDVRAWRSLLTEERNDLVKCPICTKQIKVSEAETHVWQRHILPAAKKRDSRTASAIVQGRGLAFLMSIGVRCSAMLVAECAKCGGPITNLMLDEKTTKIYDVDMNKYEIAGGHVCAGFRSLPKFLQGGAADGNKHR